MSFILEHKEVFMLLGVSWVLYALKRCLRLFLLKRKDSRKSSFFDDFLGFVCIVLTVLSLPVSLIGFSIDLAHESRISEKFERHMKLAEAQYLTKCSHCYSRAVSNSRKFGYDFDSMSWANLSYGLYIPPHGCWPTTGHTKDLQKDIYAALYAHRPFGKDVIGQKCPFTDSIIETEDDYDYYLFCLSCRYADSYNDPFG